MSDTMIFFLPKWLCPRDRIYWKFSYWDIFIFSFLQRIGKSGYWACIFLM